MKSNDILIRSIEMTTDYTDISSGISSGSGHTVTVPRSVDVNFEGTMSLELWKKISKKSGDLNGINEVLNDIVDKSIERSTLKALMRRNPTIRQAWETFNELYKIETGEDY